WEKKRVGRLCNGLISLREDPTEVRNSDCSESKEVDFKLMMIKAFPQTFPSLAIFRTIFCIEDCRIKLGGVMFGTGLQANEVVTTSLTNVHSLHFFHQVGGTDYDSHQYHEAYGEWRAYGVKLSGFGTINENRLQGYCKAIKAILRTIVITDKCIGLNAHKHRYMQQDGEYDASTYDLDCDASILLDDTDSKEDSPANNDVLSCEAIDDIKAVVESVCPSVLSCADILAVVARDACVEVDSPSWAVRLERRRGFFIDYIKRESHLKLEQLMKSERRQLLRYSNACKGIPQNIEEQVLNTLKLELTDSDGKSRTSKKKGIRKFSNGFTVEERRIHYPECKVLFEN
ncbi:putative peroxidase, partial [Tanacetum coccineum]